MFDVNPLIEVKYRFLAAQGWVGTSVLQRMQSVHQPLHQHQKSLQRTTSNAARQTNGCTRWQLRRAQLRLRYPSLGSVGIMLAASLQPAPCHHCCSDDSQQLVTHIAPFEGANGLLQLGQLTHPTALMTVWQQQVQPACLQVWEDLHISDVLLIDDSNQLPAAQGLDHIAAAAQQSSQQQGQLLPQEYLQKLDLLLGSLQQVLLICGLLKDQHTKPEWRTVAAAVFVEARIVEQQICSDPCLQQGLLLAQQHLSLQQQQQQQQQHDSSSTLADHCSADYLLLSKTLRKHMQLEGLNPDGFAGLKPLGSPGPSAQVLSSDEQQTILSGLQAEHKVLLNRMQDLLLNPAAAPTVYMEANSRDILLQPLLSSQTHSASTSQQCAAASHSRSESQQGTAAAQQQVPAAGAADEQQVKVTLDLKLVQQLLQHHPDGDVRADVWSAGVLHQLDKLLLLLKELAEIRRKIASMQGYSCYADLVLQHSFLGSSSAAVAVCEQLADALQPAATAAAEQLLQQQQQPCGASKAPQLQGSDLEYYLHQSHLKMLSCEDLQQLQPYLELQHVLSGFDRLLQLSLGLSIRPRRAAAGEVWNERVQVYEVYDSVVDAQPAQSQQFQQQQALRDVDGDRGTAGKQLGTIYLDPSGGFSTQVVLYGSGYDNVWPSGSQHEHPQQATQSSRDGPAVEVCARSAAEGPAVPCAVALGLQSHGVLGGSHTQLALGLWELCHELGHAVNFLLSAAARDEPRSATSDSIPGAAATAVGRHYHMHAAWLPLEVMELTSTLFEGFCMDPQCLQVLCQHSDTRQQMPWELATKLARFIRASHYHPLTYQHVVLGMLFDLQMTSITGRQLGQHAAHVIWQQIMTAEGRAAAPELEVSLQQLRSLPRLLVSSGQGYGYAVAWCLAQLLMASLLQHVHQAVQAACSSAEPSAADHSSMKGLEARAAAGRLLWRTLLSSGVGMSDVLQLAEMAVQLQQVATGNPATELKGNAGYGKVGGSLHPTSAGADASFDAHVASHSRVDVEQLEHAFMEHGLWPLHAGTCDPVDVLVVCLTAALRTVRRQLQE